MFFGGNHGGRIWLSRFGCASVSGGAKTAAYSNGALHTGFSADIRRGKIARLSGAARLFERSFRLRRKCVPQLRNLAGFVKISKYQQ